jgi:NodT family efflux transporter outer membrane factor (OMF) lipoprotein
MRADRLPLLLLAAGALFAAGCATKPRPLADEAARARIPALGEAAAESVEVPDYRAAWARDFGDPRLAELIRVTLEENPDVGAASARLRAASAVARIAGADRKPELSARASGSRGRSVTETEFPGLGETVQTRTANRFELGLNLSWEIDLWGRIADARQAALFDEQASRANLAGTRLSLAASLARAWFQATARTAQVALAERQLAVAEKSLRATEDRVNRGLLGSLELSLARSEVESARSVLETRHRERNDAVRLVESLSGGYPEGRFEPPPDLPVLGTPPPPAIPSAVLARRPDLVAAEAGILAADSRVGEARKSLIPTLSLSGNYGTASEDLSDLLDGDFTVWNLAGNLLQPIFQGGRLRAQVARREALLAAAIADFESALLVAFREVENALDGDAFLREAAARSFRSAELAQEAARVGFDRYERGLIGLLDVLELQNRAFDAYNRAVDLRLAALLNRVDLYAALGGGFPDPDSPQP